MAGGRPPKLFSSEEVTELGKDLLEWVKSDEGKKSFIWVYWYNSKHNLFRDDWKALIQRVEFLPYYESARQLMASNMSLNKDLHHSYGHRYLGLYEDTVHDHEMSIIEHKIDYEMKKKREFDLHESSYPHDKLLETRMEWIKAQAIIQELKEKNQELQEKIASSNESKSKTDQINQ